MQLGKHPATPVKTKPRIERNRVLVTGGAGFVGSHLCTFLVERGDHVRSLPMAGSLHSLEGSGLDLSKACWPGKIACRPCEAGASLPAQAAHQWSSASGGRPLTAACGALRPATGVPAGNSLKCLTLGRNRSLQRGLDLHLSAPQTPAWRPHSHLGLAAGPGDVPVGLESIRMGCGLWCQAQWRTHT